MEEFAVLVRILTENVSSGDTDMVVMVRFDGGTAVLGPTLVPVATEAAALACESVVVCDMSRLESVPLLWLEMVTGPELVSIPVEIVNCVDTRDEVAEPGEVVCPPAVDATGEGEVNPCGCPVGSTGVIPFLGKSVDDGDSGLLGGNVECRDVCITAEWVPACKAPKYVCWGWILLDEVPTCSVEPVLVLSRDSSEVTDSGILDMVVVALCVAFAMGRVLGMDILPILVIFVTEKPEVLYWVEKVSPSDSVVVSCNIV